MIKAVLAALAEAALELCYPLRCVTCGDDVPWPPAGGARPGRAAGLRAWDRPALCPPCAHGLFGGGPVAAEPADREGLFLVAAARTTAQLTGVVGAFKYHGVRGLAWPLGQALAGCLAAGTAAWGEAPVLVPVPLHSRRRRERGFNQAELLARVAAGLAGPEVAADLLSRRRGTAQQARIADAGKRRRNLAGAFAALRTSGQEAPRLVLVDDLVTSGATAQAAAAALRAAGWDVAGVACLGAAAGDQGLQVDRPQTGF